MLIRILCRKTVHLLLVLIGISILTFSLMYLAPGDPAEILLRAYPFDPGIEKLQLTRQTLGLDRHPVLQYMEWVTRVVQLDLGRSFRTGESVTGELRRRIPATLELALLSFLLTLMLAIGFGIAGSLWHHHFIDHSLRTCTIIILSVPNFWQGLLFVYWFSVRWGLLPVHGRGELQNLVLPVLTLTLGMSAFYGRMVRAQMIEVWSHDYIKLAYAKGLSRWKILRRHVLKNALLPIVSLWGMSLGQLLGGSAIVENIFAWPGLGQLTVDAILNRDYPVILGCILCISLFFVWATAVANFLQILLDPRLRTGFFRDASQAEDTALLEQ